MTLIEHVAHLHKFTNFFNVFIKRPQSRFHYVFRTLTAFIWHRARFGNKRAMSVENEVKPSKLNKIVVKSKSCERCQRFNTDELNRKRSKTRSRSASPKPQSSHLYRSNKNAEEVINKIRIILKSKSIPNSYGINVRLALSMSGCGFLGSYHFGVAICFQKNAKFLLSKITHYGGSSVGSLIACLLALKPDSLEDALKEMYLLADEINSNTLGALTPGFYLADRLSLLVEKFIPADISKANDRLFISITKQSNYKNEIITNFPSRTFLMNVLNASCYIPVYSMGYFAYPPEVNGEKCIDGGYSNNLPILENVPTLTVSPFSGSAIIAPSDRNLFDWNMRLGNQVMKVNLQNLVRGAQALFPPSTMVMKGYYELGYRHAMKFLLDNDFLERVVGTEL